ncbi:MAG: hypothetical protein AABX29_06570 [Nanoarchaeota archaeon]
MIDRGLWTIAQRLFEEDVSKKDSDETIGGKSLLADPGWVACLSAGEIFGKMRGRESDVKYVERLSRILRETVQLMNQGVHPGDYYSTLMSLYGALSQYPNGLLNISLNDHTIVGDLAREVSNKTSWVVSELEHLDKLPIPRLKDLEHFCVALSREIRMYDPSERVHYLAA